MKIFETERLRVEEVTLQDAAFIKELTNSPGWIEFIGNRNIKSEKDAEEYIQNTLIDKGYKALGFGFYKVVLKATNKAVGICGFVKRDYLKDADIGFALLPQYEGKGYMLEAASEMMHYGASSLLLSPVLATTTPDNSRSQKLLMKLGLNKVGTVIPTGTDEELLLYST